MKIDEVRLPFGNERSERAVEMADVVVTTTGQVLKNRHGSKDINVLVIDAKSGRALNG